MWDGVVMFGRGLEMRGLGGEEEVIDCQKFFIGEIVEARDKGLETKDLRRETGKCGFRGEMENVAGNGAGSESCLHHNL